MVYESLLLVPVVFLSVLLFLLVLGTASSGWLRPLLQLWLLCVLGLYFGYCWVKSGQTLAMKTWRIRVERTDGRLMAPRHAALRFVLACWAIAPLGLGLLWALFDREGRFLHDRLAGTRIVRVERPPR
jgi:uncharacterized RDD family membrane protein YckC